MMEENTQRAHWSSRFGFILAASGSAIGLGNIWKFPYIAGENGGGWFVLIYLVCIAGIGLPIMMAELFIGRSAQRSPVGAFRVLDKPRSPWMLTGWLGIVASFIVFSYYSVVAGWAMHYSWLSLTNSFAGQSAKQVSDMFGALYGSPGVNVFWHVLFMIATMLIVIAGVQKGVERWAGILMPMLFVMLCVLLARAMTSGGFGAALDFVFGPHAEKLTAAGILEALGHSFFTLSLGAGMMITYGSYLQPNDDIVATSITVSVFDTLIALMACLVLFPITFSFAMEPAAGPGLVFKNMPIAFSKMYLGALWATIFFFLLTLAALTSAISLLEVVVSYFIDERRWSRKAATIRCGLAVMVFGIPAALSGGTKFFGGTIAGLTSVLFGAGQGKNWFDFLDYLASNWMLPLGGLGICLFVGWRVGGQAREQGFKAGSRLGKLYWGWVFLLRYLVPLGVVSVFLHALGIL